MATLEQDFWALDGTMDLYSSGQHYGWVGTGLSGSNGAFATLPVMTIQFTQDHTSAGLSFRFLGDAYPTDITAVFYNSAGAALDTQTIVPDAVSFSWTHTVAGYRKIVLSFSAMSKALRFLKLGSIVYGLVQIFGDTNLITAELTEEVNPLSDEITINTLELSVHSYDSLFSILNPAGAYAALQQRQKMTVRNNGILMGYYYLSEWSCESENVSKLKAVDAVGLLDNLTFPKTYYTGSSVSTIVAAIFANSGISYSLDASYTSTLKGLIPAGTRREALQQVAFALGAVVGTDRSNTIRIKQPPTAVSSSIGHDVKTLEQTMLMRTLVTGVEVTAHDYSGTTETTSVIGYYAAAAVSNVPTNVLQITDATLVGSETAQAVASRVYSYYQKRYQYDIRIAATTEMAGQIVEVESWNGQKIRGMIESMRIDLVGGMLSELTVVGVVAA